MGTLPFWVYKSMSIILSRGGYPLLMLIVSLITKGSIQTSKDLIKFLRNR